jgi:predicted DNA-binding protein
MKKYSGKKKSCHYKLSEWHREKLAKLAKATRRTMTSVIEELIEKSE